MEHGPCFEGRLGRNAFQTALAERAGMSRKTIGTAENPAFVLPAALALPRMPDTSVEALFFLENDE